MFHVVPYGETPQQAVSASREEGALMSTEFEQGLLTGLLVGEGHFGGDGRQPQITLRMHVRHEALFRWLERTFPGGRLYGPYSHDGREYFQWMVRGAYLRDDILPLLELTIQPQLDSYAHERLQQMKVRYASRLQNRSGVTAPDCDSAESNGEIGYVTPGGADVTEPPSTTGTGV
jgi:hypothetical protein